MKRSRFGLQARFVLAMLFALLIMLASLTLLLLRQGEMQREASQLGRTAVHAMATDGLLRRGESITRQLADSLANPLYYADLDAIGDVLHNVARQPDVAYVLVYDVRGRVVHDGSREIAGWGERMQDPLAPAAIDAPGLLVQWSEQVMDISHPISLGGEKLGGVRVGYALDEMLRVERGAASALEDRLAQMGRRHAGWLSIVLFALVVVGVVMAWFIQHTLVAPIRQLAEAARAVGAGDYEDKPLSSSRRHDELGELVRAFSEMRDSIARHDRAVHHIAYTDALTGLSNRLAFREELDRRLSGLAVSGGQLALLFADVDDFKRINDTMGHEAGDAVLSLFAVRIREAVDAEIGDPAQSLVARFGGDEFVMLLQGGDVPGTAARLGARLVGELRKPLLVHGREVVMSTSVGITVSPDDATDASTLMKNGDIAMYQAKAAGKNCFRFYSREMDLAVERRAYLEQELHGAWERGELSLQYQPLHRFSDQKLVGAEALLRWHHPKLGLVAPAVFIEVAEQSGLIEQLGMQVLRSACQMMAQWNSLRSDRQADRLFVSVNVSPLQLRANDLPAHVASVLADTCLNPEDLHLELTETAVIGDEEHAGWLLAQLRRTGVKVWLDDFGTGFSGLSHLRRVPVDGVKIDRSFITDLLRDPDDLALTSAIISMAHSLNIIVVAEGVENAGQMELLRAHGCDLAQGHWLGYPLDPVEFARLLDRS